MSRRIVVIVEDGRCVRRPGRGGGRLCQHRLWNTIFPSLRGRFALAKSAVDLPRVVLARLAMVHELRGAVGTPVGRQSSSKDCGPVGQLRVRYALPQPSQVNVNDMEFAGSLSSPKSP